MTLSSDGMLLQQKYFFTSFTEIASQNLYSKVGKITDVQFIGSLIMETPVLNGYDE